MLRPSVQLVDCSGAPYDLRAAGAADPAGLPRTLAKLFDAAVVNHRKRIHTTSGSATGPGSTTLLIPTPWTAPVLLSRPGRPFTPTECALARRLADIAGGHAIAG